MDFADNQTVFTILLIIHIGGAIIGIGPTYAFSILGPMTAKQQSKDGVLALMRGMIAIEKKLVNPVAWGTQWITGVLLIIGRSAIRQNFWQEEWLVAAIVAYIAIIVLSVKNAKAQDQMVELIEQDKTETPEFGALAQQAQKLGPIMGLLTTFIVLMMIWKPLSECAASLIRC